MIWWNLARWVVGRGNRDPDSECVHTFFVVFPIDYIHEFQYEMFSKRYDRERVIWETCLVPSALNWCCLSQPHKHIVKHLDSIERLSWLCWRQAQVYRKTREQNWINLQQCLREVCELKLKTWSYITCASLLHLTVFVQNNKDRVHITKAKGWMQTDRSKKTKGNSRHPDVSSTLLSAYITSSTCCCYCYLLCIQLVPASNHSHGCSQTANHL